MSIKTTEIYANWVWKEELERLHKQQPRKDVELYFFSHNSTNTPPVDLG